MEKTPQTLNELPNISSNLAKKLIKAGITTPSMLKEAGAENVFIRLYTLDKNSCINMLYALEGAIQGIRWHNLPMVRKEELKSYYKNIT